MRVSVVIINFNYGRFLVEAVSSLTQQTRRPDETIVVDDGSTDDSLERLATLKHGVRLIRRANGGHVNALQTGAFEVTGDIVLFLDADDFLYPGCLEQVEKAWTSLDIAKIQFRLDTVDEHGGDQHMPFPHLTAELSPDAVRRRAFSSGIYPWTVSSGNAYSMDFVRKVLPIDTARFPRSPDGYLNKLAPLYGDVVSLPAALGAYRVHGKNRWAQGQRKINPSTVAQTVRLDLNLDWEFRTRAKELGLPVHERVDLTTPQHLEYRMLALKLDPQNHPVVGETLPRLLATCLEAVRHDPYLSTPARWVWRTWFILFAALPARWVDPLYCRFRSQTRRHWVAKLLIGLTRLNKIQV